MTIILEKNCNKKENLLFFNGISHLAIRRRLLKTSKISLYNLIASLLVLTDKYETIDINRNLQCNAFAQRSANDLLCILWGYNIRIQPNVLLRTLYYMTKKSFISTSYCGDILKLVHVINMFYLDSINIDKNSMIALRYLSEFDITNNINLPLSFNDIKKFVYIRENFASDCGINFHNWKNVNKNTKVVYYN